MSFKEFLLKNNISQYRLAKDSGVSKATICKLVNCKTDIKLSTAQKIAERLNITTDELNLMISREVPKNEN